MSKDSKKIEVTSSERRAISRAIGTKWQSVFDKFNDAPKTDLTHGQFNEIAMHDEKMKATYIKLVGSMDINPNVNFSKQKAVVLDSFKAHLTIEVDKNDPESLQESIADKWLEWHNLNFPSKKKKSATPKSVSIGHILDYCLAEGKSLEISTLKVKSLKNKLSGLNFGQTQLVEKLFVGGK